MTLGTRNQELFSNYKHALTISFIKQQDLQAVNGKKLQFSVNKNALYFKWALEKKRDLGDFLKRESRASSSERLKGRSH